MLACDLTRANPLICEHYVVNLVVCLDLVLALIDQAGEVDVSGAFPDFDSLVARARCYSLSVVVELDIVDEVIVSE